MGKIVLDRRGDLRTGVFYNFHVPFDDDTDGLQPGPDWIAVPRTPTDNALREKGEEPYRWISPWTAEGDWVETKDCPADPNHVTHHYTRKQSGDANGGKRVSPFVPMNVLEEFGLSEELHARIEKLKLRGACMDEIELRVNPTEEKLRGLWALQFVGKAMLRPPKIVDAPNACPHCGKSTIACDACGNWNPYCTVCRKEAAALGSKHDGKDDKRLPIEEDPWRVIEGKSWDGSDLVQTSGGSRCFASKRFIDWLLRIHAAPFYAEPVLFCVDGMSDEQKGWLKQLETPLEA